MACKTITDDKGEVVAIACGSAWGVGTYDTGDPEWGVLYGFAPTNIDPHDFWPDEESCSPQEIAAWRAAKATCGCGR